MLGAFYYNRQWETEKVQAFWVKAVKLAQFEPWN